MSDTLHKFLFEAAPVRAEIVTLEATWQEVLRRRRYPLPIQQMLGEMMAAAALLSANLKFNGAMIMQLHGDGPVSLLVVECNSDLSMRATAKYDESVAISADTPLSDLINLHGKGRFAITLDPKDKMPGQTAYQGIVPLVDEHQQPLQSIAQILELYMAQSEQLETKLILTSNSMRAAGLLLQKIPTEGGQLNTVVDADTWNRVNQLAQTVKQEELLQLNAEAIAHRLFWQEPAQSSEPGKPRFACSCSRQRVASMLKMLGMAEIEGLLEERGSVEINCDFCNQRYEFDAVDCAQLFSTITLTEGVASPQTQRH